MDNSKTYDLAIEMGLNPKKLSGGEYHSACPDCGGKDRFIIWASSDRYWCRQCEKKGDPIQFCRDFLGLSFKESCERIGKKPPEKMLFRREIKPFQVENSIPPSSSWVKRASFFIHSANEGVLSNHEAISVLKKRGFTEESIKKFQLGWNEKDLFEELDSWGLQNQQKRVVWLPKGLVIPSSFQGLPMKIKIRRSDWLEGERLPKYAEVMGSRNTFSFFGEGEHGAMLLESELDAMLLAQVAGDLGIFIAIGSTKRRPDMHSHSLIGSSKRLLFSLDFDEPGKRAYKFWKKIYPHLMPWPSPIAKSPGDAFELGIDLRKWVKKGLNLGG